ncbi:MAG: hypothetical protein U5P41_13285 [Gammaproteobacteria bacterium]|nr:hypothetical protein [Gammaproteobacteria bacterium]
MGVKRQFNSLGDTSFAFQYGSYNDQYGALALLTGVTGSEVERIGLRSQPVLRRQADPVWNLREPERRVLMVQAPLLGLLLAPVIDLDTFTMGLTYFF